MLTEDLWATYLGGGILTGDSVRPQLQVGLSSFDFLLVRVVQMTVDDLFGQCQRSVESGSGNFSPNSHSHGSFVLTVLGQS